MSWEEISADEISGDENFFKRNLGGQNYLEKIDPDSWMSFLQPEYRAK